MTNLKSHTSILNFLNRKVIYTTPSTVKSNGKQKVGQVKASNFTYLHSATGVKITVKDSSFNAVQEPCHNKA